MSTTPRKTVRAAALVAALTTLPACGLFSGGQSGLANVDDLVTQIERVHVDAELAQQDVRAATERLEAMVTPGFVGNPVLAHAELVTSVERSLAQARTLRESFDAMQDSAEPVFDRWNHDLDQFASPTMRQRSESRMQRTRSRYEAIVAAVEPALTHYDAINRSLNDHTLFLGHDFNSAAVADIRDDVRLLSAQVKALEGELDSCLVAARTYLDAAALPEGSQPAEPGR